MLGMPALTRRRNNDPPRAGWQVLYGDVHVGTIAKRSGVPVDADRWGGSAASIRD
jgi:hypothetical protein